MMRKLFDFWRLRTCFTSSLSVPSILRSMVDTIACVEKLNIDSGISGLEIHSCN